MPDNLRDNGFIIGPAYGRDYKTLDAVKADWNANKDFEIYYPFSAGMYLNRADVSMHAPEAEVWVRFDNLTEKELLKEAGK